MTSSFRPSSLIAQQIEEFQAILPKANPPLGDFAAQLQWESWQSHLTDLKGELEVAIDREMASSDLQISLSGKPVHGHSVSAGFLGGVLANAEKLVAALTDIGGKLKDLVVASEEKSFGLMIDGVFESSFGIKMTLSPPDAAGKEDADVTQVADQFCGLFDGSVGLAELDALLETPEVRSSYVALMKCLAKSDGQMFVRTKSIRYGVRIGAYQARQRIQWFKDTSKHEDIFVVQGIFTGGSISAGRFEIREKSNVYRGPISLVAKKQMIGIKLGQEVSARIRETKSTSANIASANEEKLAKHYLLGIWAVEESEERE